MAKRRRKNKKNAPNLPESTLERARKQLAGELEEGVGEDPEELEAAQPVSESESTESSRSERRAARRRANARRQNVAVNNPNVSQRQSRSVLSNEMIEDALANPTKVVTEEELHEEYGYVLADLRNMGVLAGLLMIMLIALAQFI